MSVLSLDSVTYAYPGASTPALAEVSLEVAPGELVVLAGGSGSGKSTLLRAANGLVPHFHGGVFTGRATVAGMDTREHGPGALAVAVGTLFQDPETQVVMGTVRAELALPLENRGETAPAIARGVEEVALAMGIAHLLDRPTDELSGGELQRLRSSIPSPAMSSSRCSSDWARTSTPRSCSPSTGSSAVCRLPTARSRCDQGGSYATHRRPSSSPGPVPRHPSWPRPARDCCSVSAPRRRPA